MSQFGRYLEAHRAKFEFQRWAGALRSCTPRYGGPFGVDHAIGDIATVGAGAVVRAFLRAHPEHAPHRGLLLERANLHGPLCVHRAKWDSARSGRKRCQEPFAGTALRVLCTKGS